MNRRVRQQLEKNGDNASNERKIDHLALLPNPKAQAAFTDYVQGEGYTVESAPDEPNADDLSIQRRVLPSRSARAHRRDCHSVVSEGR